MKRWLAAMVLLASLFLCASAPVSAWDEVGRSAVPQSNSLFTTPYLPVAQPRYQALTGIPKPFSARGYTVAYLPLDNRPVNDLRPVWLAESCGMEILLPDVGDYATRLDGQTPNPSGATYGDREALLEWLKRVEPQCDALVISMDQLLSGGLVSSRVLMESELTEAFAAIDYLAEVAQRKPVYVFETVMRLATTSGYLGMDSTEYELFRSYGMNARPALDGESLTVDNICDGYAYDESGNRLESSLPEALLENYCRARARKLRLADYLLRHGEHFAWLCVGVDDSASRASVQTNEVAYLQTLLGENGWLFCGADELGMMAIARLYQDLCPETATLTVRYFGGQEDSYTDSFDSTTLRSSVEQHLDALGAVQAEDAPVEALVLTGAATATEVQELLEAWEENDREGRFTMIMDLTSGTQSTEAIAEALKPTNLLGFSAWGTGGNTIGISLSMGLTRWNWMVNESRPRQEDSACFARQLIFAMVKDLAYCRDCRYAVTEVTPEALEAEVTGSALTQRLLERFCGCGLAATPAGDRFYPIPAFRLTNFSAPLGRRYEIRFDIEFSASAA